jgi:hypothetical protein
LGFCLLTSSYVFLLGCGSGLTIFKFHHIANPCPLAAILFDHHYDTTFTYNYLIDSDFYFGRRTNDRQ